MASISIFLIKIYRYVLSPDHGVVFSQRVSVCRFYPSCSEYAILALERRGFFTAWMLIIRRVLRCNPWTEGGIDKL